MYTRYRGDPYWTIARFNSNCGCGKRITKHEDIFYYPRQRKALCKDCGDTASREFDSMAMDEDFYNRLI